MDAEIRKNEVGSHLNYTDVTLRAPGRADSRWRSLRHGVSSSLPMASRTKRRGAKGRSRATTKTSARTSTRKTGQPKGLVHALRSVAVILVIAPTWLTDAGRTALAAVTLVVVLVTGGQWLGLRAFSRAVRSPHVQVSGSPGDGVGAHPGSGA